MEHLGGLGVIRPRTRDPSFGNLSCSSWYLPKSSPDRVEEFAAIAEALQKPTPPAAGSQED
jgi:hypothetical protein